MQESRMAVACSVVSFIGLVACGAPKIADNSVTVSQDESTRVVKVSYSLVDAPAVVTVNVLTNGVPVCLSAMWHVSGAVNRLVKGSGPHEILWSPDDAFPEIGKVDISAELTRNCRIAQKKYDAEKIDAAKKAFYRSFRELVEYRKSVEGDFICNFHKAARSESRIGWPHGKLNKEYEVW